jgi:glutaredoxin
MPSALNLISSTLASTLRGWQGISARTDTEQPEQLLNIYDIENCPFCRIVREVLTELDLDAIILPCPKGGDRFRAELLERGGKHQFPYLSIPTPVWRCTRAWTSLPTCMKPTAAAKCR